MEGARHQVNRARGFTLLEILVVLALAAIILALVLPRLGGGLEGLRVRTASRQVAALLRSARVHAIARGQTVAVTVDPRGGTLQVESAGRAGTSRRLTLPAGIRLAVLDEAARPRGDRPTRIRFSPRGGSDGGALAVTGAGRRISIVVDPLTGRVSIQ